MPKSDVVPFPSEPDVYVNAETARWDTLAVIVDGDDGEQMRITADDVYWAEGTTLEQAKAAAEHLARNVLSQVRRRRGFDE